MERVTIRSPAKLNLGLRVLFKRPDGYHEIETVMLMVDLCDELSFEEAPRGIEIVCNDREVPIDELNLAYKAALALIKERAPQKGVRIEIAKRIPISAGLGGGSSNGAATLLALDRMWGLGLGSKELMAYACRLGSDAPFFTFWHAALATGRGEALERINPARQLFVLIVCPAAKIPTGWAYENLKIDLTSTSSRAKILICLLETGDLINVGMHLKNDLEEVVCEKVPAIAGIKAELIKLGALGSSMSGSGPCVFGIFASQESCLRAKDKLMGRGWNLYAAKSFESFEEVYWKGKAKGHL